MLYPNDIPYLKVMRRKVFLPPGEPIGRGNLIYLYSTGIDESIKMMNEKDTFSGNNKYFYYYYPVRYMGQIRNKRYRLLNTEERAKRYEEVSKKTKLNTYPIVNEMKSGETRNTYFDLSTYLKIFSDTVGSCSAYRKMELFWDYLARIINEKPGNFTNRYILMNIDNYKTNFKQGDIKGSIDNPLYMIYFSLYKRLDFIRLLDIDFLFYTNGYVMRFNPSKSDEKTYKVFLIQLKRLLSKQKLSGLDALGSALMKKLDKDYLADKMSENITNNLSIKADMTQSDVDKFITSKIATATKNAVNSVDDSKSDTPTEDEPTEDNSNTTDEQNDEAMSKAEDELNNDEELINDIYNKLVAEKEPEKSSASSARDAMLREKQKEIKVKNMTIKDLEKIKPEDVKIEEVDVSKVVKTTNENMKNVRFANFNKTYNRNIMNKDIVGAFKELNNKSIGMFILDIDIKDTSDELNYKDTWTVHLEDENRQRHTIKVDVPKFIEDKFLWIGGNRKIIKNQNFFLPLVKVSPEVVHIVTNYNKMIMERVDSKSLQNISILDKLFTKSETVSKYFVSGNVMMENKDIITTIDYDSLARRFRSFKCGKVELYFSQKEAQEVLATKKLPHKKDKLFIGIDDGKPIYLDINTQRDDSGRGVSEIILTTLPEDEQKIINTISVPKRLCYTKITTMEKDCPISVLMCLWEGLSTFLKKARIDFHLASTPRGIAPNEAYIRFKNCYLIYDNTIPNELLMNGLKVLDTQNHDISEYDGQEPYLPFFEKKYGKLSIINALNNVYEFTIGNIEREILNDMNLPTDLVELMIHANSLLCDNAYKDEIVQTQSRIRCAEVIPAILYDTIAKAYVPFKNSNGKKKLTVPQDAVIKKLLAVKTVEDYSSLNPLLELESTHAVSQKGWRGINLDDAYTIPKRAYDKTMTGIIGPSSPPDAGVGLNRTLTMEPKIKSVRGYVEDNSETLDNVKDVNLFSPAELLVPMGVSHDDIVRTGHSVKQSRHVIPVKKSSPVLISNGSEESARFYLSSDFVVNAEQDGVVIEKDEKTKIMIVEYKDGSHRAINLDKNIVKNGGGGFELSNILITDLNVGDKFKANECLAWHKDFFRKNSFQGTRMCMGTLTKIAITSTYGTHEDSAFITEKLSDDCSTEMCFKKPVTIGRNSNVTQMVKIGDEVTIGDPLISFDENFEESDINKLLANLSDSEELEDAVVSSNKNIAKAHHSGVIEDIKMYSTVDLEELSPSLQEIFGAYYKRINKKKSLLNKYDKEGSIVKCGMLLNETTGKIEPNRYGVIRGEKVNDGVLIEFYIKHEEPLEVGSKIAHFTALKTVVSEVIKKGYEPYSEFRKDEEIGTAIAPNSILARMTPSILLNAFGNKCIIELKRSLFDIWKNTTTDKRRVAMEQLIYKFFSAIDKSGENTKKYKSMFGAMSDAAFTRFFKDFFEDEMAYLILDVIDYERTIGMPDIEDAAKVLNIPLYERVYMPHINDNKEEPVMTPYPVPVGYINIKRTQQTVAKKNGISTSIDARSAITGQVTRADKNGRESDLENTMLVSLGMNNTLKELNGPRADDLVAKQQMLQAISTKGYVQLADLDDNIENKTTLNTVDTYFLGMTLKTDLVTKGMKLMSTLKSE